MEKNNEIMTLFESRSFVYKLFQSIFGNEPSAGLIDILAEPGVVTALELFEEDNDIYKNNLSDLIEMVKDYDITDLKREYTKLFIGPDRLPAPPWESVYLSGEPVLLDENTLKVRRTYMEHGFIPEEYPHVADDHLSLELDFMYVLSKKAQNDYGFGKIDNVKAALAASKSFLDEHLLVWTPEFAAKLEAKSGLYPKLAALLVEFLKTDSLLVLEILDNI